MTGLLTARAVAELLEVNPETVLRWTRRGDLAGIRLPGGAIRYREDALEAWLELRATPRRGVLPTTPDAAQPGTVALTSRVLPTTEDEE